MMLFGLIIKAILSKSELSNRSGRPSHDIHNGVYSTDVNRHRTEYVINQPTDHDTWGRPSRLRISISTYGNSEERRNKHQQIGWMTTEPWADCRIPGIDGLVSLLHGVRNSVPGTEFLTDRV